MKNHLIVTIAIALLIAGCSEQPKVNEPLYPFNPEPLLKNKFTMLPLGAVTAGGWLVRQLEIQKNSLTGHLDEFWPDLMNSSWRGGDGEAWERGPYYLDGLVPLAVLLDDPSLKEKVDEWMDFILNSKKDNGWFGPEKNIDRWPLAVGLKVLKQYYEGSGDERAINIIKDYFNYLNDNEPDWPDSEWRGVRAMENAVTGYWLYKQTGDTTILNAIQSIHDNCYDWTEYFEVFPWDGQASKEGRIPKIWDAVGLTAHVVNVAMATKYPGIWFQQSKNPDDLNAALEGIKKLDYHHGQVGGRFSGDEHLSGTNPTQGTEMCAVVEYMFSLENLIEITGDNAMADRLELLAFNSLPGTQTGDGWGHQYDQQANQVLVSNAPRNWSSNGDESNVFGMEPNFGCCTANMHQGWPKYTRSLWMATHDAGLVIISYAPSVVEAKVGKGQTVIITNETDYPFGENISLKIQSENPGKFPLYLRVPGWCDNPQIIVNGTDTVKGSNDYLKIEREWSKGDNIDIKFPMEIKLEERYNNSVAVKLGPLYFSTRISKVYSEENLGEHSHDHPVARDWKIEAKSTWNFGLIINRENPASSFKISRFPVGPFPFADSGDPVLDNEANKYKTNNIGAPVVLEAFARPIPEWKIVDNSAGELPGSPVEVDMDYNLPIQLVPYASAKLRISEFPIIKSE